MFLMEAVVRSAPFSVEIVRPELDCHFNLNARTPVTLERRCLSATLTLLSFITARS